MKKIVLLLMLVIVPAIVFCAEPKIESDKINSDGSRFISCNYIFVGKWTDRIRTNLSLSAIQIADSTNYYLSIKLNSLSHLTINPGSSLVIRFGDNEVVQLKTRIEYSDVVGRYDSYSHMRTYTILPSYEIDSNLLDKIEKYGIRKFRIETTTENIDRELKDSKLKDVALFLSQQYLMVQNAIANKENDILEGF